MNGAFPHVIDFRKIVEAGGGTYVGQQDGLVYYNSKQTGSTLVSKVSIITPEQVREHIRESNKKFGIGESL
jgi:hypothetical protein